MTDTSHIEQRARELLAAECDRTVEGMHYDAYGVVTLNVALSAIRRALSARASAGEGGNAILSGLLDYIDAETCTHEETHRGGAIWTICDGCDRKWADDEGGFVPHEDAPAVAAARKYLAAAPQPAQAGASGGGEVVELRICEVPHLMLRRDQLYRFTVDPNCEACRDAAAFGTAPASPATGEDSEEAAKRYIRDWCPDSVRDYVAKMETATPQPESERGEWHEAVVEACMRIEGGYKANDPRASLRAIEEWWYQLGVETTADGILGSKALAAAQPQQAPAQECGANGAGGCSYRPCGPIGESQCQFCGAPPAHEEDCQAMHQHLLDMLGAKDHVDAGRVIGELHLTTRPTPEAQEANWVNDLWNRRRAEAADLDKGEEFAKGKAAGIRSVLVEVVMFVTKGAALALPAQGREGE